MKQIPKKQFDKFIELSHKFWDDNDNHAGVDRYDISMEISKVTGVDWLAFHDLVNSIIRFRGFFHKAENEVLYNVLNVLGWEVVEDV